MPFNTSSPFIFNFIPANVASSVSSIIFTICSKVTGASSGPMVYLPLPATLRSIVIADPGPPPTISNPISAASISCPTIPLAVASPTPPPKPSTTVDAPKALRLALLAVFPAVIAAPPTSLKTLLAIPPVKASIIPIVAPRPADLVRILNIASSSCNILPTFFSLNSNPLSESSS